MSPFFRKEKKKNDAMMVRLIVDHVLRCSQRTPTRVLLVRKEEETKDSFYNWKTRGSFGMLQE